jgi:hypothetical protein
MIEDLLIFIGLLLLVVLFIVALMVGMAHVSDFRNHDRGTTTHGTQSPASHTDRRFMDYPAADSGHGGSRDDRSFDPSAGIAGSQA